MKVSLAATVRDEAETIERLLSAIDAQTRPPDEVVVVDGGSTDGTLAILERWADGRAGVIVRSVPGANIAAGRNAAIKEAGGPVIAVTDAGCTPDPRWLEKLAAPFETGSADVVMGFYRPDPRSAYERILGCLNLPDAREVDAATFMPSSRSIAFTKELWEKAGGYPEWLDIGEDMYFNFRCLEHNPRRVFVPDAVVTWRLRPNIVLTLRQYFRYAEGDGIARMYLRRHALRFGTYGAAAFALTSRHRRGRALAAGAGFGIARMLPAYRRAFRRLGPPEATAALIVLPALELLIDAAKMAGYLSGRFRSE